MSAHSFFEDRNREFNFHTFDNRLFCSSGSHFLVEQFCENRSLAHICIPHFCWYNKFFFFPAHQTHLKFVLHFEKRGIQYTGGCNRLRSRWIIWKRTRLWEWMSGVGMNDMYIVWIKDKMNIQNEKYEKWVVVKCWKCKNENIFYFFFKTC